MSVMTSVLILCRNHKSWTNVWTENQEGQTDHNAHEHKLMSVSYQTVLSTLTLLSLDSHDMKYSVDIKGETRLFLTLHSKLISENFILQEREPTIL
jgi:hypothetical protein